MTRRRIVEAPLGGRPATIEVVPLPATPVITIGQDNRCWSAPEKTHDYNQDACGAIVRIRPPAVSDAVLAQVVSEVRSVARAWSVEPRPWVAVVPASAHDRVLPATITASSARHVVLQLVEESRTEDRDALRTLCEEIMSACNL